MPRTRLSSEEQAAARAEKVAAAHAVLAEAVAAITSGDDWRGYLDLQSRLHTYSIGLSAIPKCLNAPPIAAPSGVVDACRNVSHRQPASLLGHGLLHSIRAHEWVVVTALAVSIF
jgi:hypothetical protein